MKILEFAFVAYCVSDMKRAREFYEGVLGLKPNDETNEEDAHWVEYEIGPHVLGIGKAPFMTPGGDGCAVTLEMEDLDESLAYLKDKGVNFAVEPFETPVCRGAIITDPDGNKIGIHKRKKKAE
ncbi:MAG: VOC family protein [Verrucomicrobium sp.]|nr:VOC family protein [Verrucomicrobium sp.]